MRRSPDERRSWTHAVAEKITGGLAVGDLDGDARPEIVVASGGTGITVLRTQ